MDATTLLERDHREAEGLFEKFARTQDADERRGIVQALIKDLSIHSEMEKLHLYPVIRDELPGGRKLSDGCLAEHQKVEELLARIDGSLDKAGTKEFADLIARVERDVEAHVEEEEAELFPKLREALTRTRLDEIGKAMARAKKSAPTRPHPMVPNEGLAHEVLGRAAGAMDRVRDQVSGR